MTASSFNMSGTAPRPRIWSDMVACPGGYRRVWFYRMPTPWLDAGVWRHVGATDSWPEAMAEVAYHTQIRWYVRGGAGQ